jgi:hypothetical protein
VTPKGVVRFQEGVQGPNWLQVSASTKLSEVGHLGAMEQKTGLKGIAYL